MATGKVQAGGWEVMVIGVYVLLVSEQREFNLVAFELTSDLAFGSHVRSTCRHHHIQGLTEAVPYYWFWPSRASVV